MNIRYSLIVFIFFNLSMLTACEKSNLVTIQSNHPILDLELFNAKKRIIKVEKIRYAYSDIHHITLEDDSDIQHIDFVGDDNIQFVDSYTLHVKYKDKKNGVVASTKVLDLSPEQLKKLRSSYSQLYPVE